MNIKVFDFGASLNLSKSPLVYLIPPPNTLQVQLRQTQTIVFAASSQSFFNFQLELLGSSIKVIVPT
jgi:hypothetical protein